MLVSFLIAFPQSFVVRPPIVPIPAENQKAVSFTERRDGGIPVFLVTKRGRPEFLTSADRARKIWIAA